MQKTNFRWHGFAALTALLWTGGVLAAKAKTPDPRTLSIDAALPVPNTTLVDRSLPAEQVARMTLAARRYYGFWHTGRAELARAALASDFKDLNLPAGRPQGPEGPLVASHSFRTAVPDLRLEVEEMLVIGDRVVGRLHFRGHFTGAFGTGEKARRGDGRSVDFVAIDVYRIRGDRIAENWHLEDNLTLLHQLGLIQE
ncbi:MAG TPA: ester cyclase [Polyangiaceae bacterium]|nr:ester cyclase [Polyangiaceae bacterium]